MAQATVPRLIIADRVERTRERLDPLDPTVKVWHNLAGDVFACCRIANDHHELELPDVASFYFDTDAEEVRAVPHRPVAPELVHELYTHYVLPMVLPALGREVLHASGIVTSRGVLALTGPSGIGKSTIAFALHRRGYGVWADDALALDLSGLTVQAVPLPFQMQLRPASAAFFGNDVVRVVSPVDPAPAELRALCVLKRLPDPDAPVNVNRLSATAAFLSLLAQAFSFTLDVKRKRTMVERYLALATRVPVFEIGFAPGLDGLPAILDGIEQIVQFRSD